MESNRIVTTFEISRLVQRMPEGDRHRVLKFCQALQQQRSGKRYQRSKRFTVQDEE